MQNNDGLAALGDVLMGASWDDIYGDYLKGKQKWGQEPPDHLKWHASLLPANT